MTRLRLRLRPLLLVCSLACTDDGDETGTEDSCLPGSEGCVCTEGAACDPGSSCVNGQCVADGETETTGDGDGDPGDGDGDGDPTTTGDGDGDGDGDGGPCHPLMIDCPIGSTCTWDGQSFLCNPSMTKLGDSCVPDNPVCVSGFCAEQALVPGCPSTHCCAGFCNLESPFCSEDGTTCVDHFPASSPWPEVGACIAG